MGYSDGLIKFVKIQMPMLIFVWIIIVLVISVIISLYLLIQLYENFKKNNKEVVYDLSYKSVVSLTLVSGILFFVFNCLQQIEEKEVLKFLRYFIVVVVAMIIVHLIFKRISKKYY